MIQQILLNTRSQKPSQDQTLVGSGVKNPLPIKTYTVMAMSMAEFSWFFTDETLDETFLGCGN